MLSTTFLLSKTFLLSQFSPPSAAHAFNYNIPFIKNILFIKIFPPSAAHAFNYIPFIKNIPFITISPPLCSPCFQLQHSFYRKHSFYHNFPPLCSPQHSRHTFAFVRPYLTSFYQNFSAPLQPMLSTTTFLLSKTFLYHNFPPPSAAHNIADTHLPLCDPTWLSFIKILPPLCSPCFQLHSFYQKHSFYHNFPPPLQPMLSTTFLLSKTFLLSQFTPPSAAHAFNYNIPFIKNITFIKIFPPLYSPQHCRHTFAFVRPYLTSFYQYFPPPLCSPCFQLLHSFCQTHSFYQNFPPPSAAHAFNYNIPFIKNIPFITIFPPLCSPQHSRHTFAFVRPYLTSFYQNFPSPLQPMLSTTTFLLTKTFLLSQFSPPLQPMLSTTFLLSKFSPPSAAHAFNDSGYYGSSPNFLIHVQRRTEVGSHNTPYRPLYPEKKKMA